MPEHSSYKILIVEDNPGDAILIEDFLFEQFKSLRTTISTSFRDARKLIIHSEYSYDIILLDLTLPDKTGFDLIDETINVCKEIPVIVLTGYADLAFGVKSLSLGISDYILKDELNAVTLYKSIIYSLERKRFTNSLKESEKRYSDLFHLSPLPMWVFDTETLQFLDVNEAAINHYGYSFGEFLSMTIKDIRPEEEINMLDNTLAKDLKTSVHKGIFKHKKKDGAIIHVDIQSSALMYKDKKAKIVVSTDVTENFRYTKTIENQNQKFREIAWIQSHVVRAPLARLMGLVPLIKNNLIETEELDEVLNYIQLSANELDGIIRAISQKATDIDNM